MDAFQAARATAWCGKPLVAMEGTYKWRISTMDTSSPPHGGLEERAGSKRIPNQHHGELLGACGFEADPKSAPWIAPRFHMVDCGRDLH
ncbi:hypothetical protein EYF80_011105 [Liparis tanakae]|uniref:Uncharacterized protein n=1 Tax=Liparis tanakae TaxID=230148 RepID=A0A4Z2ILN3_9TELE|nr:hypothetical protein EYF80_011105 [Liparis tanakae]